MSAVALPASYYISNVGVLPLQYDSTANNDGMRAGQRIRVRFLQRRTGVEVLVLCCPVFMVFPYVVNGP